LKGSFDVCTIAVRVADEFLLSETQNDHLFEIVPFIAASLDEIGKAAMSPVWNLLETALKEVRNSGSRVRALYSGTAVGAFEKESIIKYLNFDHKQPYMQHASFKIAMDLVTVPAFQPHILSIIPQISGTRNNLIYPALIKELAWLLPKLIELNPQTANYICSTVLDPLPFDDECAPLILQFLIEVPKEIMDSWPVIFDTKKIIRKYIGSEKLFLVPLLRKLMAKTGFVIDAFEIDWIGPELAIALELCEKPLGALIREAAEFGLLPLASLGSVLLKLARIKNAEMAEITWNTFLAGLQIAKVSSWKEEVSVPVLVSSWKEDLVKLSGIMIAPIEESPFFKLLAACKIGRASCRERV
jgi:hypothetical protein